MRTWIAVVLFGCGTLGEAGYTSPQVQALTSLRASSSTPVRVAIRSGFPVHVTMNVYRPGFADEVSAARGFLAEFAALYGLDRPEIALTHTRTDAGPGDERRVRFAETFHGVPVLDAELVVHVRMSGTSAFFQSTQGVLMLAATTDTAPPWVLDVDLAPAITETMAEDAARAALGAPGSAIAGETKMMVHDPRLLQRDGAPRLVWRVSLPSGRQAFVDAETAEVRSRRDLWSRSDGFAAFDLQLDDALGGNSGVSCYWFTETESIADAGGIDPAYAGDVEASIAWHASRGVYQMFHEDFGRHSYDDADAQLEVWVHANLGMGVEPNAQAASWCGIEFSNGWVSRDVLAHEYGHMVIDETSDLVGEWRPGSLNESFSDIIGILIDPADWIVGEERACCPGLGRSVKDPQDGTCAPDGCTNCSTGCCMSCPDRESRLFVYPSLPSPQNDSRGVHVNSGIVSKAFHLMIDGGDLDGYPVEPMGRAKAAQLAYAMFTGLSRMSDFVVARMLSLWYAEKFVAEGSHGFTTEDVCTVRNAFRAVEIGQGDLNCDGIDDNPFDEDGDGIPDDGDDSGSETDTPCHHVTSLWQYQTWDCDDNCTFVPNPTQKDSDGDGDGDACDLDDDEDGVPDAFDPCLGVPNEFYWIVDTGSVSTPDSDGDGTIDCYDDDDDEDGIPDDGDGSGDTYDSPCPSEVTTDCDDNCRLDPNPSQYDGNANGYGDACDPDKDHDGLYVLDDNCTFVGNSGQEDTDGDGLGDACDLCPTVADWDGAYHPGYFGGDPFPAQQDSDGDGVPDACDGTAYGQFSVLNGGVPYSPAAPIRADDAIRTIQFAGPPGAGGQVRLTFPACDPASPFDPHEHVQLRFFGMPATLNGWVEDDSGRLVARLRSTNPLTRGLRFRPRCDRTYAITLLTATGFTGNATFSARANVVTPAPGESNPYDSDPPQYVAPPPLPPDLDGDGLYDAIDSCPAIFDPTGADPDGDGVGSACDDCPDLANPTQGPVDFGTVLALDAGTFGWPDEVAYNWVSGSLAALHSGEPFAGPTAGGTGQGSTFSVVPHCAQSACWFLWKHARDGCGSWGTAERDASLPTFCTTSEECAGGRSCLSGTCS